VLLALFDITFLCLVYVFFLVVVYSFIYILHLGSRRMKFKNAVVNVKVDRALATVLVAAFQVRSRSCV
jgi:hypothetical protein